MHTKSVVVIALLMVSSSAYTCGSSFFAPEPNRLHVPMSWRDHAVRDGLLRKQQHKTKKKVKAEGIKAANNS